LESAVGSFGSSGWIAAAVWESGGAASAPARLRFGYVGWLAYAHKSVMLIGLQNEHLWHAVPASLFSRPLQRRLHHVAGWKKED
jgi:hypothetical protein